MRRNKEEMSLMRDLVNHYLSINGNHPQKAYNDYITYFLTNNIALPNYIDGLKDFTKLSKDRKHNETLLIEDLKKQKEKSQKDEQIENMFLDNLNNLTFKEVKEIYNNLKAKVSGDKKEVLVYLYMSKADNSFNIKDFKPYELRNLKEMLL